jgi:hypothetical protein
MTPPMKILRIRKPQKAPRPLKATDSLIDPGGISRAQIVGSATHLGTGEPGRWSGSRNQKKQELALGEKRDT